VSKRWGLDKSFKIAESAPDEVHLLCTKYDTYDPNAGYAQISQNNHITAYKEKPAKKELDNLAANKTVAKDTAMFIASQSDVLQACEALGHDLHHTYRRDIFRNITGGVH
jgi:hypothetical protein